MNIVKYNNELEQLEIAILTMSNDERLSILVDMAFERNKLGSDTSLVTELLTLLRSMSEGHTHMALSRAIVHQLFI